MVSQFPLDAMHLVDLGIGKLIVSSIMNGIKKQITDLLLPPRPNTTSAASHRRSIPTGMNMRHGEFKKNSQVFVRNPRPLED